MKEDFSYSDVPATYTHCLHAGCPRSAGCLRFQVGLRTTPERAVLKVVNPAHVLGNENNCQFFTPDRLSKFALGITNLLDKIPHSKAERIHNELYRHFGRNKFYRVRGKERLLTPSEQALIRRLFLKEGIEDEPEYDRFVYQYEWE